MAMASVPRFPIFISSKEILQNQLDDDAELFQAPTKLFIPLRIYIYILLLRNKSEREGLPFVEIHLSHVSSQLLIYDLEPRSKQIHLVNQKVIINPVRDRYDLQQNIIESYYSTNEKTLFYNDIMMPIFTLNIRSGASSAPR